MTVACPSCGKQTVVPAFSQDNPMQSTAEHLTGRRRQRHEKLMGVALVVAAVVLGPGS